MKIIDPGHRYELPHLDGSGTTTLQFVKREGSNYPGNEGSHEGVITQEVLRALIHRGEYVDLQMPCEETRAAIRFMQRALHLLEVRAARRHERPAPSAYNSIHAAPHDACGHVGCSGGCGRTK